MLTLHKIKLTRVCTIIIKLSLVLLLLALFDPPWITDSVDFFLVTIFMVFYSASLLCCTLLYEKGKVKIFARFGQLLSIVGFVISISALYEWVPYFRYYDLYAVALVFGLFTFAFAHSSFLLFYINTSHRRVRHSLYITLFTIFLTLLIYEVGFIFDISFNSMYRAYDFLPIFGVLFTIITLILHYIYNKKS